MSEVKLGTLYDFNKAAVAQLPALNNIEFQHCLNKISNFLREKKDKYFMLLNRETANYTLFNLGNKNEQAIKETLYDLKVCLKNRGKVVSIEPENNDITSAFEIWIIDETEKEPLVYYFFPYDLGVIEHGMEAQ